MGPILWILLAFIFSDGYAAFAFQSVEAVFWQVELWFAWAAVATIVAVMKLRLPRAMAYAIWAAFATVTLVVLVLAAYIGNAVGNAVPY